MEVCLNMEFKGTRWYKTDLHLHTPASMCFRDRDTVSAKQWVDRCLEQGLDVVAITDHNTGEWIDEIKKAAEDTNLVVFPGVEVTCSESKVHMLVLFDIDKTRQDIEDFLINININREKFASSEANSNLTTNQLVDKAKKYGAIVIPAHIDEYNGISEIKYNNREELLKNRNVNAVQVVHDIFLNPKAEIEDIERTLSEYYKKEISDVLYKNWQSAVNQAKEYKKTFLTFSDNPHKEGDSKHGLWGIGKRFTWIKMNEKVNLESLNQALFLSEHRIRNDFEILDRPYKVPDFWFKKLIVKNTILNKGKIELDFSPQMTSIIGGRGSGKSSIIKFIRGVFQRTDDLKFADSIGGASLKREQEDFFKISNDESGVLLENTIIEIIVNKYGTDYKIIAENIRNDDSSEIEVFKRENNNYVVQGTMDLNEFFKFDVYSQKQIFEIAKYPNALRERIDNSIIDMDELATNIKKKKNEYIEHSAKIRTLKFQISKKPKIVSDIKEKNEQISSFRESGFESLVKQYKKYSSEHALLIELYEEVENRKEVISNLRKDFNIKQTKVQNFNEEYQFEISKVINPIYKEFENIEGLLKDAEVKLEKVNLKYIEDLKESKWYTDREKNTSEFKKTKDNLAEKGVDDLNKLEIATSDLTKLERNLKEIDSYEEDLDKEHDKQKKIQQEYEELRLKITQLRKEFLENILSDGNIKIEIDQFRDRDYYTKRFREIIQKEKGFNEDIKKIGDKCFHGKNVIDNQRKLMSEIIKIRKGNSSNEFGGRFVNVIKELNEEQIDELMLLQPEDDIKVKYRPNNARGYQLLSNASAGQKTSAILTFLLSYGDTPLLLDQPEDDLDNHLIYELIVDRLKLVKNSRQIIVVTHNANIPVNGDTEWLVAMNSKSKDIETLCNGTVEEHEIKTEICDVMEGGKDAFKLRAKRYNL